MGTFQSFYSGFVIFILCCLVGFIMSYVGGTLIDRMYDSLDRSSLIKNETKLGHDFAESQDATMWFFINLYYFLTYAVPCIGAVVFFQSIVRRTSGDRQI